MSLYGLRRRFAGACQLPRPVPEVSTARPVSEIFSGEESRGAPPGTRGPRHYLRIEARLISAAGALIDLAIELPSEQG
jgi:hypothetical protein